MRKLFTFLIGLLACMSSAFAYTDIFDGSGNFSATQYTWIANNYSSSDAIIFRYGTEKTTSLPGAPTWWQPSDHTFLPHYNSCDGFTDPNPYIIAQLNQTDCLRNDFGSNVGDLIFRPTNGTDPAVHGLLSLDLSAGNVTEKPQTFWVYGNTNPDPYLANYPNADKAHPIAVGRCSEHDCAQMLVAFQDGTIAAFGSNTASRSASFKFPAGKVPTAIAITSNSEFALVTIWDTVNLKGQVAVLGLGSLADGPSPMSWGHQFVGLRNMSDFVTIKLLGYVDLPTTVKAPTSISAATDFSTMQNNLPITNTQGWLYDTVGGTGADWDLSQADPYLTTANQQSFRPGGLNGLLISRSGVAVVASKAEKKIVFLNLKPLFDYINGQYFNGTLANLQSLVNSTGLGDTAWPPVFSVTNYAPTIILTKDITADGKPTAVLMSLLPNPGNAYIATEDGVIHVYNVKELQAGTSVDPTLIVEKYGVQTGLNPTGMIVQVNPKEVNGGFGRSNTQIWTIARGDQKANLIDVVNQVYIKELKDSRLVDPISIDETQQSPMLTNVLSITDYNSGKLRQYRYHAIDLQGGNGPLHIGMGPTGNDNFEYGGDYSVAGKPFGFTQSNVP